MVGVLVDKQQDTQPGVGDAVGVHTLGALDSNRRGPSLFLVDPVLETHLVDPLSGSPAPAGTGPLLSRLLVIVAETHPTGPTGEDKQLLTIANCPYSLL